MRTTITLLALTTTGLVGCGPSAVEAMHPAGTSTVAADADYERIFAVNVFESSVSVVDPDERSSREIVDVGEQPTRVARVGDRMVVTLRGERALAELDATTGELIRTVPTGPEPYGVVASRDGAHVFVSVALAGQIEERDGSTLEVLRTFDVGGEPRWMALHPSGNSLVVAHATGETLTSIDLDSGEQTELNLPAHTADVAVSGQPLQAYPLAGRVTGDPTFSTDGRVLAVPGLYVDNTSGEPGSGAQPTFPYYSAGPNTNPGRFNAGIALYRVREGQPEPESYATQLVVDFSDTTFGTVARSYLTSLTATPDGLAWMATMEASDAVLLVDATDSGQQVVAAHGYATPAIAVGNTGRGPRGVAALDDGSLYTHTFMDNQVADVRYEAMREGLRDEVLQGGVTVAPPVFTLPGVETTSSSLSPEQLGGMDLFYSATSSTMGAAGVSCSTCHFEGRSDGLTWHLMNGERQTPSLAGLVSETAPVTWTNSVPTVAEEAQFTTQFRMGANLGDAHAANIEAFVDFVPLPDTAAPADAEAIARGKAVFEREDVGCAECHSGDAYTDNQHHDLYGLAGVNTPTLLGISATAPYLHDGSAQTLRDVLVRSRDGSMGDTSMLSDAELRDLELFLRSL